MAKRKLDLMISMLSFVAPMLVSFAVSAGEPVVQPASLFREFSGSIESNGGLKATLRGQLPRACAEHFRIFSTGQVDDKGFVVFSIIDESAKGVRCIREGSWRSEDWVSFESLDRARYQVTVDISSSSVDASRPGAIRVGARGPMPPVPVAERVAMEASSCTQCNRPPQPGSGIAGGPGFRDDLKSVASKTERGRGRRPPGENDRLEDGGEGGPSGDFTGDRGSRERKRFGSSRRRSRSDFDDDDDDDVGVARAARGGGGGMNSMYGGGMNSMYGGGMNSMYGGGMNSMYGGGMNSMYGGGMNSMYGGGMNSMYGGGMNSMYGGGMNSMYGGGMNSMYGGGMNSMYGGGMNSMYGGGMNSMYGGGMNSMYGGGTNSMYGGGMMPSWYVPSYGTGYGAGAMTGYGSQQMGMGSLFGGQATTGMSLFPSLATGSYGYGQGQNSMLPYGLWGR